MSDELTAGQRAALAVEDGGTRADAELHGAPYSVVKLARVVRERSPETFAELRAGRIGVTKAHKIGQGKRSPMMVPLEAVRMVVDLQPRAALFRETIEEYAQGMAAGVVFPPVTIFLDGEIYWLADGFHRTHGALAAGLASIEADVRQGGREDAILFAAGANATHGMRRTNEDKRRAVRMVLEIRPGWSDREIGQQCHVDGKTVAAVRPKAVSAEVPQTPPTRKFNRGGSTHEMVTGGIGAGRQKVDPEPERKVPDSPLWEGRDYDKDWIGTGIRRCCEMVEGLPSPEDAARDLQVHQSVVLDPARLRAVVDWFVRFLELREAVEPERQALYRKLYEPEAA